MAGSTTITRLTLACRRRGRSGALCAVLSAAMIAVSSLLFTQLWQTPAQAQTLSFPERPKPLKRETQPRDNAPMLVQATEIRYDYANDRVLAVGNVQIYYG